MDNIANAEKFTPCCCGSTDLKELKPYGIESVQCSYCHVSLLKQDWNRVMNPRNDPLPMSLTDLEIIRRSVSHIHRYHLPEPSRDLQYRIRDHLKEAAFYDSPEYQELCDKMEIPEELR
ncbi:MAG: hypothetical protein V7731_16220 [Amphritea sp.]